MPRFVYQDVMRDINLSNIPFSSPKKIQDEDRWFNACRKVKPSIPRADGTDGWYRTSCDITETFIKFTLENKIGERSYLVIDRKYDAVGNVQRK